MKTKYNEMTLTLSSLGPGHLQVNSESLKSQGLSQISKRPGPGACSYNCNVTQGPMVQGSKEPGYLKVIFKYELDSKECPSCYLLVLIVGVF